MGPHAVIACLFFTLLLAEVTTVSASEEEVKISATPIFPRIPRDKTKKHFQVLVSVKTPTEGMPHLDTDLVLVHSIRNTKWKDWAENATRSLKSRENEDHSFHVHWEPSDIKHNDEQPPLKDLLNKAIQTLNDEKKKDQKDHAGLILVLTDVEEQLNSNAVNSNVEGLVKGSKYTVHTLGLGAEHDVTALRKIASASTGGSYSFIDDPKSSDDIYAALAVCLGGFKDVIAHRIRLQLEAGEGVQIEDDDPDAGDYKNSEIPKKPTIEIGVLQAGEMKNFIVHLTVQANPGGVGPQDGSACGNHKLLNATLWRDAAQMKSAVACVERPQGVDVVHNVPHPLVVQNTVRFELLKKIKDQAKRGKKKKNLGPLELKSAWEEFEQEHRLWSGMDVLLGGLECEINAMVKHSNESSSGWAYFYSWISSYQTQRPTALGSPDNVVAEFHTDEVKFMVKVSTKKYIRESECTTPMPCVPLKQAQKGALEKLVALEDKLRQEMKQAVDPMDDFQICKDGKTAAI